MAVSDEELFVGDENDSNSKVLAHETDPHEATMQQQVRYFMLQYVLIYVKMVAEIVNERLELE